jgi:hypothetical protein
MYVYLKDIYAEKYKSKWKTVVTPGEQVVGT